MTTSLLLWPLSPDPDHRTTMLAWTSLPPLLLLSLVLGSVINHCYAPAVVSAYFHRYIAAVPNYLLDFPATFAPSVVGLPGLRLHSSPVLTWRSFVIMLFWLAMAHMQLQAPSYYDNFRDTTSSLPWAVLQIRIASQQCFFCFDLCCQTQTTKWPCLYKLPCHFCPFCCCCLVPLVFLTICWTFLPTLLLLLLLGSSTEIASITCPHLVVVGYFALPIWHGFDNFSPPSSCGNSGALGLGA